MKPFWQIDILRAPSDEGGGAAPSEPEMATEAPAESPASDIPASSDAGTPESSSDRGSSVERAFRKAGILEDSALRERPETEATGERERGPDGRFVPKAEQSVPKEGVDEPKPVDQQAKPQEEAKPAETTDVKSPSWMTEAAKAKWAATPVEIRADMSRRIGELENGLTRYQSFARDLQPFDERARQGGTTLPQALKAYTAIEDHLRQDIVGGLDMICQNAGTSLRDVAAHILGQPAPQKDAQIEALQQHIKRLEQQVGGVQETFQKQALSSVEQSVTRFAAEHPRFDELSSDIAHMLKTGYIDPAAPDALEQAYAAAERLKPAPAAPAVTTGPQTPAPTADQTRERKSGLSVQGAPGSNPPRTRSRTSEEAARRALSQIGIPMN